MKPVSVPLRSALCAALLAAVSLSAQAALFARPGGMVYDDVRNITWLADWNYAKTSGSDADGLMNWNTAKAWADTLDFGGYSDWRLPSSVNVEGSFACGSYNGFFGLNCTGGEMGHMFYNNWGATAGGAFSSGANTANLALFSNVQSSNYWSGTEYNFNLAPYNCINCAWAFGMADGTQGWGGKGFELYAVAVRDGDVAAVPEPQSAVLALAGLGVVSLLVRRRKT